MRAASTPKALLAKPILPRSVGLTRFGDQLDGIWHLTRKATFECRISDTRIRFFSLTCALRPFLFSLSKMNKAALKAVLGRRDWFAQLDSEFADGILELGRIRF